MKTLRILSIAVLAGIAAVAIMAFIKGRKPNKIAPGNNRGFAVVELYTSEGCSSCPPADELVGKIERETSGKDVYILAFHVDYWNRLGWKDQFSNADYSRRQSEYARYLHLQGVYTPQIVVNGRVEFVGSEEGKLRNAINANLLKPAAAQLDLNVTTVNSKDATVRYTAEGTDKNSVLQMAVLEKAATSKVERGENGGRTLTHVQIVCKFQSAALNGSSGMVNVILPTGFDTKKYEIIGFLQNKATGTISGAARASIAAEAVASR